MMSNRRRLIMANQSELPSGYTRCKYLESSGTQYINTGIRCSDITFLDIVLTITNSTGTKVFGANANTGECFMQINRNGGLEDGFWGGTNFSLKYSFIQDEKLYISIKNIESNSTIVVNNKQTSIQTTSFNGKIFRLFGITDYGNGSCSIYSAEIGKNEDYTFCGIPALNNENIAGMYDTVSNTFFTNQGTGEFGYELLDGTYVAPQ